MEEQRFIFFFLHGGVFVETLFQLTDVWEGVSELFE